MRSLVFFLPAILVFSFLLPPSGYRHLWQDEIETAERARAIVETGLPRTIDAQGRPSLNAGGRELEEGDIHRYTPWMQFYAGSSGLALGRVIGFSPDFSLRIPFILAHATTSSLLSYGLVLAGVLNPPAAVTVGTVFGFQTVRILHNRTARYHALLDVLFALGMVGLCLSARGRRPAGNILLGISIFLLPHTHTLGGSVCALLLGLTAFLRSFSHLSLTNENLAFRQKVTRGVLENLISVGLPAVLSLFLLLILTRPWAQSAWGELSSHVGFRSLRASVEISYAFYPYVIAGAFLFWKGARRSALVMLFTLAVVYVVIGVLDLHPFSQTRYYLALPVFFLFWPLALGWPKELSGLSKTLVATLLLLSILAPEAKRHFAPFQGLRVVVADWQQAFSGAKQPLHEAVEKINADRGSGAVLIDYVPQFVNWYLSNRWPALMPDVAGKTKLNATNPTWQRAVVEPEWHIWYPNAFNGLWICAPHCSFRSEGYRDDADRYQLISDALGRSFEMCVVQRWATDRWNNAPFSLYEKFAFNPEGNPRDVMVLARRCLK